MISRCETVFELKFLVFDQSENIMALERQNEIQSKELAELRTMIRTQQEQVLHLQRQCAKLRLKIYQN